MTKRNQEQTTLLIWQAITPVHSGSGQTSAGLIDLPIAREIATNFPVLPASSIKGVFRDGREDTESNEQFGSPEAAGTLSFTDARLLCLPVRSYAGTFAFLTCPFILNRLGRDLKALELPDLAPEMHRVNDQDIHLAGQALLHGDQVLLTDIDLNARPCELTRQYAQALAPAAGLGDDFTQRFAVVSDTVFSFFAETAMEVTAHIRLEPDSKTVSGGALWYEEALPAESLLSSFLINRGAPARLPRTLQIGGKSSVGRGLLRLQEGAQ